MCNLEESLALKIYLHTALNATVIHKNRIGDQSSIPPNALWKRHGYICSTSTYEYIGQTGFFNFDKETSLEEGKLILKLISNQL